MAQNIRNNIWSELFEIFRLFTCLAMKKVNIQHVLFLTAFFTFGIGDGITAAYMMERHGVGIEANPVIKYLFSANGFSGMVMAKIWFTLLLLFTAYVVQFTSPNNMYWTLNGFLVSLIIGGAAAINANISAITGNAHAAPEEVIFVYLLMVVVLVEIGSFIDGRTPAQARTRGFYPGK